ncbi:MAG: hypothetical protein IJU34_02185 [Bacteroidales bacterium]|nr:hypothetical protein [Bacteroidales bacterium]
MRKIVVCLAGLLLAAAALSAQKSLEEVTVSGAWGTLGGGIRANLASGRWDNQLSASYGHSDGYSRNAAGGLPPRAAAVLPPVLPLAGQGREL